MTKMLIGDVSLNVKVMGHGYPLVLMHGGPGADLYSMMSLKPLADQFTLVFYDHRCNGRSEGADVSSMTWENLTADADALREKLGFEKWAVLGHSFGGYVAMEYALRYPEKLVPTGADRYGRRPPLGAGKGPGNPGKARLQPGNWCPGSPFSERADRTWRDVLGPDEARKSIHLPRQPQAGAANAPRPGCRRS